MISPSSGLRQKIRLYFWSREKSKLPRLRLREFRNSDQSIFRYPCVAELTPIELRSLNCLLHEFQEELGPEETLDSGDLVHFALQELQLKIRTQSEDLVPRLMFHLLASQGNLNLYNPF